MTDSKLPEKKQLDSDLTLPDELSIQAVVAPVYSTTTDSQILKKLENAFSHAFSAGFHSYAATASQSISKC